MTRVIARSLCDSWASCWIVDGKVTLNSQHDVIWRHGDIIWWRHLTSWRDCQQLKLIIQLKHLSLRLWTASKCLLRSDITVGVRSDSECVIDAAWTKVYGNVSVQSADIPASLMSLIVVECVDISNWLMMCHKSGETQSQLCVHRSEQTQSQLCVHKSTQERRDSEPVMCT